MVQLNNANVLSDLLAGEVKSENIKSGKKSGKLEGSKLRDVLREKLTPVKTNEDRLASLDYAWTHGEALKKCQSVDEFQKFITQQAERNVDGQIVADQIQSIELDDDGLRLNVNDDRIGGELLFTDASAAQWFYTLGLPSDLHRDKRLGHDATEVGMIRDIIRHRFNETRDDIGGMFFRCRTSQHDDNKRIVRAVLSERYSAFSDLWVVDTVVEQLEKLGIKDDVLIQGFRPTQYEESNGTVLKFNALMPTKIAARKDKGVMSMFGNSDVGRGNLWGSGGLFSQLCANGLVLGLAKMRERKLPHRGELSDERIAKAEDIIRLAIVDTLDIGETVLTDFDGLRDLQIESGRFLDLANAELDRHEIGQSFTKTEKVGLFAALLAEERTHGSNAYSVVNGVTRYAHSDLCDDARGSQLEEFAGRMFASYCDDGWLSAVERKTNYKQNDKEFRAVLNAATAGGFIAQAK